MNVHSRATQRDKQKQFVKQFVSFDVFDTFVMRACATPDGVIERAFQLTSVSAMFPDVSVAFVEHRRQAEARARKNALARGGSSEVGIAEIYALFPYRLFGLSREMLPQLIDAELRAEIELCRANPAVLLRYTQLRAMGARTGFISDTYWSTAQLELLLRSCCLDLQWDFLYSSSDSGTNKGGDLFKRYLAEQAADPRYAVHLGDNIRADIDGAEKHGIDAIHLPQADAALTAIFGREASLAKLLCQSKPSTLDGGMRTLRRLVAAQTPKQSPAFELGRSVLGPVMHAFDAFVADRIGALARPDAKVCIGFLGRDGFLSHRIWTQSRDAEATYLEINRRVGMMASADTLGPLIDLIKELPALDAATFASITKYNSRKADAFFARLPNGQASGRDVAKALPGLIDARDIAELAAKLRRELMTYLRARFPGFDTCTDFVVVDLGYSGSIQKALRRVFDIEGVTARIHGLYLLTLDDGFCECGDDDSFEGMISDIVVTPHVKRMLLRNVAVLEQMCCAPTGSVLGYRDGVVVHEDNLQAPDQLALADAVQAGTLAAIDAACAQARLLGIDPFSDLRTAASVAVATLGRLLLLPTDAELVLLGTMMHDVNLGTTALTPFIDAEILAAYQVTQSLPDACTASDPPMWLAGSFAALSPAQSYLYALFGANLLPSDIFGDARCGELDIALETRSGTTSVVQVACYRNGHGEIRIRIPMSGGMAVRRVTVPVAKLAPQAAISGPFLQTGASVARAVRSDSIVLLQSPDVTAHGLTLSGAHYDATLPDAALTVVLPVQTARVAVLSIGLAPSRGTRVLALD